MIRKFFIPKTRAGIFRRAVVLTVAIVAGVYGLGLYNSLSKVTKTTNPLQLVSAFKKTDLKTTNGRTNILIAGYSADDAGHAGATLTDSIMILSIKQSDHSATIISIPRDLYVNVSGLGYTKINAAYQYGASTNFSETGYAAGGMGLLEKTIQESTGISLNYYALINYAAFKDTVNAVGGVTVDIQNTNGVYDSNTSIDLPSGESSIDGTTALNLARSRGEGYGSYGFSDGDFSRTEYQQHLLVALKEKLSNDSVSLNPTKIAKLVSAIASNVQTDMSLGELRTLYGTIKSIQQQSITSITLNSVDGQNLLQNYTTRSGQSTLIPAAGVDDFSGVTQVLTQKLQ